MMQWPGSVGKLASNGFRRQGSGALKNDETAPPARDMQKKE
jgi:hypothetical protein